MELLPDVLLLVALALTLLQVLAADRKDQAKVPIVGVSIEDFIDLDSPPSAAASKDGLILTSKTGKGLRQETTDGLGNFRIGLGPVPPPLPVLKNDVIRPVLRHTPLTSDDEDVELSGDGSGSGDGAEAEKATLTTVTGSWRNENVTSSPAALSTTATELPTPIAHNSSISPVSHHGDALTIDTPFNLVVLEGGSILTERNRLVPEGKRLRAEDGGPLSKGGSTVSEGDLSVSKEDSRVPLSGISVPDSAVKHSGETSAVNVTAIDVVYTADVWPPVPVKEQTDEGKDLPRWSPWLRTSDSTEVRVRTCSDTHEACNGTQVELRHCDPDSKRCDVKNAVVISEEEVNEDRMVECGSGSDTGSGSDGGDEEADHSGHAFRDVKNARAPGEVQLQRGDREDCRYSLFDVRRGKYLLTHWSLSQLVTQAKVGKWCARPEQFLVFHSPYPHCRRYYKDLCHISTKCKGSGKTEPRARGDFAEGCWRPYVYGGQLPVGLSSTQAAVYLICQRYAANSAIGKWWGHKRTHFATLYDTKGRAPLASLTKLTELGDTAWPETPYFIEHGLVEDAEDTAWFLRKAKKGVVSLADIGKCQEEDSCQLGAHQVLPGDYSATIYRPAHMLWPELAGPDPLTRAATFTLTNTAPMHPALYPAWQKAVQHVREFASRQCGLPTVRADQFVSSVHHSSKQFMHHYYYGAPKGELTAPELYLAAGVIPSRDPLETIGNDVNVPFMFWSAVCCVTNSTDMPNSGSDKNRRYPSQHSNDYLSPVQGDTAATGQDHATSSAGKRHMSFAFYARNSGSGSGSGGQGLVVGAPVQQLEVLLQDVYKVLPQDVSVSLFPAYDAACSELSNDYSRSLRL